MGELDPLEGKKEKIHTYFENFLKEKYYEKDCEKLTFEDFYAMSEEFLTYKGLPVLLRDVVYNLLGYMSALGDSLEETSNFYKRLINDNQHYMSRKENI